MASPMRRGAFGLGVSSRSTPRPLPAGLGLCCYSKGFAVTRLETLPGFETEVEVAKLELGEE